VSIEVTLAASSTPVSASSVTVAGCPTLTSLMSDSLNGTVIVKWLVLTISAKPELELLDAPDELDPPPPSPPAVVAPVVAALLEPELELEEPAELPEVMASPGEIDSSETTVPAAGA
jgi:hypothetical protein